MPSCTTKSSCIGHTQAAGRGPLTRRLQCDRGAAAIELVPVMLILAMLYLMVIGAINLRRTQTRVVPESHLSAFVKASPLILTNPSVGAVIDQLLTWSGLPTDLTDPLAWLNTVLYPPTKFKFNDSYTPPDWMSLEPLPNRMATGSVRVEAKMFLGPSPRAIPQFDGWTPTYEIRSSTSIGGTPPWNNPSLEETGIRALFDGIPMLKTDGSKVIDWYDRVVDECIGDDIDGLRLDKTR